MAATPTPADRGKTFLQGVIDKIDPSRKAHAEALLEDAGLLEYVGNGALRQDEFSRSKDRLAQETAALTQRKTELEAWYAESKPVVDRAQQIVDAGGAGALDPDGDPKMPLDPKKLQEEIDSRAQTLAQRMIVESERNAIPFVAALNDLSMKHFHEFGELLDTKTLTQDPRVYDGKHGLEGTYTAIYGERYIAKAQAAREAELAAAKAAGMAEGEAKVRASLPTGDPRFPLGQPAATPMGEALTAVQKVGDDGKVAPRDFRNRVDERAAAQEYQSLVAGA